MLFSVKAIRKNVHINMKTQPLHKKETYVVFLKLKLNLYVLQIRSVCVSKRHKKD